MLVWALPRSLATTGGIIIYFLFLRVLRCFSSPRSPPLFADDMSSTYRVVPFGNPRIKGHLHLPGAYRSLSRPSSPVRAKASTVRPFLLSSTALVSSFTLHGILTHGVGMFLFFPGVMNVIITPVGFLRFACCFPICQRSFTRSFRVMWRITDSNR